MAGIFTPMNCAAWAALAAEAAAASRKRPFQPDAGRFGAGAAFVAEAMIRRLAGAAA